MVPVPVTEPVFDGPSPLLDQGRQFVEHSRRVVWMQTVRPALRIGGHLLRGEAHDRSNIFADKCAREIPRRVSCVDDRRTDRQQVLVSLAGATEFSLYGLAPGLECLELTNALAQPG